MVSVRKKNQGTIKIIQRNWQHWEHKTQDKDTQLKKKQKPNKMSNTDAT